MQNKLIFTLLLLTFSAFLSKGNVSFFYKPAVIITNDNDTLSGFIRDRGGILNSKACFFKEDIKSKAEKYKPGDIKAYWFVGDKYYQSGEIWNNNSVKMRFLEVLVKGNVSLYHFWNNKDRSFFIQKSEGELIELSKEKRDVSVVPYQAVTIFYEQHSIEFPIYLDSLNSLFADHRRTISNLESIEYNKKSLINITRGYIKGTCGTECIQYEKDLNFEKPQFGFYSGLAFNTANLISSRFDKRFPVRQLDNKTGLFIGNPFGIFMDLQLPLLKDNIALQFEVNTVRVGFEQDFNYFSKSHTVNFDYRQLGLVWLIKYEIFQKNQFSPSIGFGKNTSYIISSDMLMDETVDDFKMHSTQKEGWFLELGLEYKLKARYSLFSNFRMYSLRNLSMNKSVNGATFDTVLADFEYPVEFRTYVGSLLFGLKF